MRSEEKIARRVRREAKRREGSGNLIPYVSSEYLLEVRQLYGVCTTLVHPLIAFWNWNRYWKMGQRNTGC